MRRLEDEEGGRADEREKQKVRFTLPFESYDGFRGRGAGLICFGGRGAGPWTVEEVMVVYLSCKPTLRY